MSDGKPTTPRHDGMATFNHNGKTLFVNIQGNVGVTFAI